MLPRPPSFPPIGLRWGTWTATEQYVDGHPRLIRSLQWGDSDYKGHVIDAVAKILELDQSNLGKLLAYPKIQGWLNE